MKRIRIETAADVSRWDTYELEVPDDFELGDDEAVEEYLNSRLAADDEVTLIGTDYESYRDKYPPQDQDINAWKEI